MWVLVCQGVYMEVRGQLAGLISQLPSYTLRDQTQDIRLGYKSFYPCRHLPGPM